MSGLLPNGISNLELKTTDPKFGSFAGLAFGVLVRWPLNSRHGWLIVPRACTGFSSFAKPA
jgi:hypothetical protein